MVRASLEEPVIRRVFVARFGESAQLFDEFGVRHPVLVLGRHPARTTEDAAVDRDARQGTYWSAPSRSASGSFQIRFCVKVPLPHCAHLLKTATSAAIAAFRVMERGPMRGLTLAK